MLWQKKLRNKFQKGHLDIRQIFLRFEECTPPNFNIKKIDILRKISTLKNPSRVPFWPTESCKRILSSTFEFLQSSSNCFLIFLTVSEKLQHYLPWKILKFCEKVAELEKFQSAPFWPTESYKLILSSNFAALQHSKNSFLIFLSVPEKF